jgi:hypothetical protein
MLVFASRARKGIDFDRRPNHGVTPYAAMRRKKTPQPPEAGRWRNVRQWVPASLEVRRLTRLTSLHAVEEVGRTSRMSGCTCDLCRHAQKRLDELGIL